jgi:hypothetical protein
MNRTYRALAMLVLSLALLGATSAVAAAQSTSGVEDQNDRLLRNLEASQAERTQAAVQLHRAMERNLAPAPPVADIAAQPARRTYPAVPGRDVAVVPTLLVGLIGGLVGGAAAMASWTAASRRRLHRVASAT